MVLPGKSTNGELENDRKLEPGYRKDLQALHTILYFKSYYPSTTERNRIMQETIKVLKGDGRSLLPPTLRSQSTPPSAARKSRYRHAISRFILPNPSHAQPNGLTTANYCQRVTADDGALSAWPRAAAASFLDKRHPQVPCTQSPPFPEPRSLAGRHQAVRPWCLLTQDIATSSKGVFPWRRKNRANRRTAPIP